ncbi:MAG: transcription antitermination factor NusB [Planctomycetota bacterium]|jgi:N utilization substance protein B
MNLMSHDLRRSRILAMQALSQWDVQKDTSPEALAEFFATQHADGKVRAIATELLQGFWSHQVDIDARISDASEHWSLQRMSTVDRNTMRTAVSELMVRKTPPKVVIDEAIEIAREYGGKDSPRFVNGVLDSILQRIREETC